MAVTWMLLAASSCQKTIGEPFDAHLARFGVELPEKLRHGSRAGDRALDAGDETLAESAPPRFAR